MLHLHRVDAGTQDNCAVLTNYTLATPASLDSVYNATGLVIIIEVQRFFWFVLCHLKTRGICAATSPNFIPPADIATFRGQ